LINDILSDFSKFIIVSTACCMQTNRKTARYKVKWVKLRSIWV